MRRAAPARLWAVVLCLALNLGSQAEPLEPERGWRAAAPDFEWQFPRDHWSHPDYRVEWWYCTGHLRDTADPSRRFGYQFTIFRIGLEAPRAFGVGDLQADSDWATRELLMGHAAITDINRGEHRFSEVLQRAIPMLSGFDPPGGSRIVWSQGPAGTAKPWELHWNGAGFDMQMADVNQGIALSLKTRAIKPRIFQGPNGFSRKSKNPGLASLYYSFTRLHTTGTLEVDGTEFTVEGLSWMDKEFSTSHLDDRQVGWDWFSVQLDDGSELMLYRLRRADGSTDFSRGTRVDAAGKARYLEPADWRLEAHGRWTSQASGATYPAGWTIHFTDGSPALRIEPLLANQENVGSWPVGLAYWEGAVAVKDRAGAIIGQGYVELTGYGEGNRPPI